MAIYIMILACISIFLIFNLVNQKEKNKKTKVKDKNFKSKSTKKQLLTSNEIASPTGLPLSDFFENDNLIQNLQALGAKLIFFKDPPKFDSLSHWIYFSRSTNQLRTINLNNQTCDCDNFQKYRTYFPRNSVPRFCKCLNKISRELHFCNQISLEDPLIDEYIKDLNDRDAPHPHFLYLTTEGKNRILITHEIENFFINVFSYGKKRSDTDQRTGPISRYGYKGIDYLDGSSWSYGIAPVGAAKIREIIQKLPTLNIVKKDLNSNLPIFSLINLKQYQQKNMLFSETVINKLYEEILKSNNIKDIVQMFILINHNENQLENFYIRKNSNTYWKKLLTALKHQNYIHTNLFDKKFSNEQNENLLKIEESLRDIRDFYIRSIDQVDNDILENRQANKLNIVGAIIDTKEFELNLQEELSLFEALNETQLKLRAISILNAPLPEWYDKAKGHTHRGYEFSNFSDEIVKRSNLLRLSKAEEIIVAYFSSLALKDGTASIRTLARMLKYKGTIYKRNGRENEATIYERTSSQLNKL